MYITVKSIKRNLGFKGIEISDIVIALPMIILFIVLFCFTPLKIPAIVGLMIGIFCLLPINVRVRCCNFILLEEKCREYNI